MKDEQKKREKRRRRRVRNQLLAYMTLMVLAVTALVALYFGANGVIRYIKNYNDKVNEVIAEAESDAAAELASAALQEQSEPESSSAVYEEKEYSSELSDDPLGELVDTLLQEMTVEEMVAGMFLVTPESLTGVQTVVQAGEGTKNAIVQKPVGGLVYSAKNFQSGEQFQKMLANTKGFCEYPLFFAVTAECGADADFGIADTKKASEITGTDQASEAYGVIAETLASYGVNMNFAPVSEIVPDDGDKIGRAHV